MCELLLKDSKTEVKKEKKKKGYIHCFQTIWYDSRVILVSGWLENTLLPELN